MIRILYKLILNTKMFSIYFYLFKHILGFKGQMGTPGDSRDGRPGAAGRPGAVGQKGKKTFLPKHLNF
jgi:hypothetical protein